MTDIQIIVNNIDDEIEDAKIYAEKSLQYKAEGNNSWANRYREMSTDELKHATYLHELAVSKIDQLKQVYTAPVEMQEKWDKSHAEYVEKVAWIKMMLNM